MKTVESNNQNRNPFTNSLRTRLTQPFAPIPLINPFLQSVPCEGSLSVFVYAVINDTLGGAGLRRGGWSVVQTNVNHLPPPDFVMTQTDIIGDQV